MDAYQETFATWNKIASLYQDKFMHLDLYNESYDFVCQAVNKENAAILEIGCGPGNITKYLLAKRPDFHILGIDIAPNMIALARKNNPIANFSVMDCREIGTMQTKYDAIICGFCLPYLSHPDSKKLILDAAGLLHENGFIYISFVEGDPKNSGFQVASSGDRSYFYYHKLNQLSTQLVEHDFETLQIFKVPYEKPSAKTEIHTILTAKKFSRRNLANQ